MTASRNTPRPTRWRKWFRVVHRDVGYFVAALTIAYSLSGIAVNHIEDWNPSYTFENQSVDIAGMPSADYKAMADHVVATLDIDRQRVRGHFMETESLLRVYLADGEEVAVDIETGRGTIKKVAPRTFWFEVNALHLNNAKGIWTYIADLFAISLLLLVVTGIFMNRGRTGLAGRGKWYLVAGLMVPISFVWYIHS